MRKFWLTFWFYFKENFTKKSLVIYGLFFAGVIGISFAIDFFGGRYSDLAVVNETDVFAVSEEQLADLARWNVHFVDSEEQAREMLDAGDVDEIFIIEGEERPSFRMISPSEHVSMETELYINQLLTMQHMENMMTSYDLPAYVVADMMMPIESSFESLLDTDDGIAAVLLGAVIPIALYSLILMSGQGVATSVVAEKSSRVMEVMLGKVHPTTTMLARILAYFGDVFVLILSLGLGALVADQLDLMNLGAIFGVFTEFINWDIALLSVVIVLLGYFTFIFLYAMMGAMANSVESLNSVLGGVSLVVVAPMFTAMWADLGSAWMNVLVYVPVMSPFVIIQRFLRGYSSLMEVGIVTAIMAVCAVGTLILAARINKNGVSHTSEKMTFKDFKKLLQK